MAKPSYSGLTIRKLADKTVGARIPRWNPDTGEKYLFNPATPDDVHEPWPSAGIQLEGEPVTHARIPTSFVSNGLSEGWLTTEGARPVMRSGGPRSNPWLVDLARGLPHVFVHCDAIVLHTVDGDVRYRVVENPDKWPEEKLGEPAEPGFGGEVRWFYDAVLEDGE